MDQAGRDFEEQRAYFHTIIPISRRLRNEVRVQLLRLVSELQNKYKCSEEESVETILQVAQQRSDIVTDGRTNPSQKRRIEKLRRRRRCQIL